LSRYRRSPITALPPAPREQIDRELQKLERAFSFEVPDSLDAKADQSALDGHVQNIDNPHATTHAQLPDRGSNTHDQIDDHLASRANPHQVTHAQLPDKGSNSHTQIDDHIADNTIHGVNVQPHIEYCYPTLLTWDGDPAATWDDATEPWGYGQPDTNQHAMCAVKGLPEELAALNLRDFELSVHANRLDNPHRTVHGQLPDRGTNTHDQIDDHIADTSIHAPLPDTATLGEAAAGTEAALRSWSPALVAHAITNLSASFDIDALPQLGSAFVDTDRMAVSRGGTEQRAPVTRIAEYIVTNPSWYGTSGEITTGTVTDGRIWTPAILKTAINALAPTVVTDHGALTGLSDDDHTQYHTDARGDARYDALGAAATVQGNLNTHTGNSSIHTPIPALMPEAEAEAGVATTQRTISADVLAAAIDALGAKVSGWTTYTPDWYATSGSPTIGNGTLSGRWRRVGDTAEVEIYLAIGSTTSISAAHGPWRFAHNSAGAGLAIDNAKMLRAAGSNFVGTAFCYNADAAALYSVPGLVVQEGTSTSLVRVISDTDTGDDNITGVPDAMWRQGTPFTWADGDFLVLKYSFPNVGWSA
jgi:hypothetical protein